MKITDPDVIKSGEKDLIDAVKDDLDLDTIKDIMQNRMNAKALVSKGGEIVVHNNAIAFRLDFNLEISGSLMFLMMILLMMILLMMILLMMISMIY